MLEGSLFVHINIDIIQLLLIFLRLTFGISIFDYFMEGILFLSLLNGLCLIVFYLINDFGHIFWLSGTVTVKNKENRSFPSTQSLVLLLDLYSKLFRHEWNRIINYFS